MTAIAGYALSMRRLEWSLPLLVVLDPFAVTRYAGHTTLTTFKAALVGIVVAIVQRRAAFVPAAGAVRWPIVALAAVVLATAATIHEAAFRAPAIRETLKSLEYLLIFSVAACVARREPAAARAVAIGAVATVVAVAVGAAFDIVHPQSGVWIGGHAYLRLAGALEGPNQLAAWLGIMLPVAVTAAGPAVPVVAAIGCTALALTLSRGGSAQTLLALIAVGVASPAVRRVVITGSVAFLVALGAFALANRSGAVSAHLISASGSVDAGGTGSRDILWRAALAMFRAHPILGVGAGNFELRLPDFGAPPNVRTQANSLYLESLADGGIVLGTATIVAAWLPPLLLLFSRRSLFVTAVGIAGVALAAHGLIDDVTFYTKVGQCWWLVAGTAAGSLERRAV